MASSHGHDPQEMHNEDVDHEQSDVDIRAVIMSAVVLAVVCITAAVLMYGLWWVLEKQAAARDPTLSPLATPATQMPPTTLESPAFGGAPDPKLLTNEPRNLQQIQGRSDELLHSSGWVDEKAGVARIPIDLAKELVATRGLPVRPDPIQDPLMGARLPTRGESSSGRLITRPPAAASQAAPAAAPAPAQVPHKPVH
jgi:hypothetical protein